MRIDNQTKLNMVIGYPLVHSQSSLLHNSIYQSLNINAVLLAFPSENIESLVRAIKTLGIGLVAVTMPYKEKILPYLDVVHVESEIQAVNTVLQRDGQLHGYNTDIDGIVYALRHVVLANKNVLLLGAGGAARAVAHVLHKNQAHIVYLNRSQQHAQQLASLFGGKVINHQHIQDVSIDIIINATPLGMYPHTDQTPLVDYPFHAQQIVFDMVYNPIDTLLLQTAKLQGATCISGQDMFIGQGLRQIELWLNEKLNGQQKEDMLLHLTKVLMA